MSETTASGTARPSRRPRLRYGDTARRGEAREDRRGKIMWTLKGLIECANSNQTQINGKWVPARPLRLSGLKQRLQDAWAVLRDRADAFVWPESQ